MKRPVILGFVIASVCPALTVRAEPAPATESLAPERRSSFYVRGGAAVVKPIASSRELELADVQGAASLAVENGPIEGSGARVSSAIIPAATIGYVLPTAGRRWAAELVLGTPFTVTFEATGTLANESIAPMAFGIPTGVGPLGSDLGEAQAIPLVVTAVYQLIDHGAFRPFVGAGPSVLFTRDAKVTNAMLTAVHRPEMSIAPAPGLVLQGGLEARLWKSVYARIDVKFIAFMLARAEVRHIEIATPGLALFESVEVGTAKMNVWVNPLIVQAGIGFDFDL
jgi:outer membrane protein W